MKAKLPLVVPILFFLLVPTPGTGFPIRVDFAIDPALAGLSLGPNQIFEPGSGYFLLDSSVFPDRQDPYATVNVGGPPRMLLQALSIDYMGRHWELGDVESVGLAWNYDIPAERLTQADWGPFYGWQLTGSDICLVGADQGSLGSLNGEDVRVWWDVSLPELALAMPEPPVLPLLGLGIAMAAAARRVRRAAPPSPRKP